MTREELNSVSGEIIDSAILVHRELGPGLLESAYEACLFFELSRRGLSVRRQVELPIVYQGHKIDSAYRLDLLVAESVVVELKAIDAVTSVHKAQLLSYLKISKHRLSLLINFNVELLKHGITRIAN